MSDHKGRIRLTKAQRETVDQIVLNGKLSKLTLQQTQDQIQKATNLQLSESWIAHIRYGFKKDCQKQIKKLALDRYEFISHYMERIAEVKNLQQKFWEAYMQIEDPFKQILSLKEAREQTVLLLDLIEHLPLVATTKIDDFTKASGSSEISVPVPSSQSDISQTDIEDCEPVF